MTIVNLRSVLSQINKQEFKRVDQDTVDIFSNSQLSDTFAKNHRNDMN